MKCGRCKLDKKHYQEDWPQWYKSFCGFCLEELEELGIDPDEWSVALEREVVNYANFLLMKADARILESAVILPEVSEENQELVKEMTDGHQGYDPMFSLEQVEKIRREFSNDTTMIDLAKEWGCSPRCISSVVRGKGAYANTGTPIRAERMTYPSRRRISKEDAAEIRRLFSEGESGVSLGKKFGCHRNIIYAVVNNVGAYANDN